LKLVKASQLLKQPSLRLRGYLDLSSVFEQTRRIVKDVEVNGDQALLRYARTLDGVKSEAYTLRVSEDEIKEAYSLIDASSLKALKEASSIIRSFHLKLQSEPLNVETRPGVSTGLTYRPLKRVGVYVPKGRHGYPSTALMTIIPARTAGVEEVVVCTPPLPNGSAPALNVVAAIEAGASQVFKVGGAQAIAAMAFGTQTIPRVDKIVGPGNIYVTAAKLIVSLHTAIDMPAGPSEVVIVADEAANPHYAALDLLAQAEHDPLAFTALITTSETLAKRVLNELNEALKGEAPEPLRRSLTERCWIVIAEDLNQAVQLVNELAPEHLEVMVKDPEPLIKEVRYAGAIFIGDHTPTAIGDYAAGPSHVLPSGGHARGYSGLSRRDFERSISLVKCTKEGLRAIKDVAVKLAELEGFVYHARSILAREAA